MASFQELITSSDTPVLVDFYADWCGPCQMMNPVIEQVAKDMSGKVKVIKVNVDKNQAAAAKYGIRGIPAFILFHKGTILWRHSGGIAAHQLEQVLKNGYEQVQATQA